MANDDTIFNAGRHDFVMEQGARFLRYVDYQDSNGAAIDITGYSARMKIRTTAGSATVIASYTSPSGGLAIGGTNGRVTIDIADETTAGYSFDAAVYDLEIEDASGNVTRLLEGAITLSKEVTY